MKTIKKVASTPIDNTARVIDSFNTGDDQQTNAPSISAVKNYVSNEIDDFQDHVVYDLIPRAIMEYDTSVFYTFTTSINIPGTGAGYATLNYPSGFNQVHTMVIGFMANNEYKPNAYNLNVRLDSDNIKIVWDTQVAIQNMKIVLTLMKV